MGAGRHDHTTAELRDLLKARGLRATSPRLAVLAELHEVARPLSHEELMERLGPGRFDRATIYRILADLSDAGILTRMDLGDHVWRHELVDACRKIPDDHAHFLCTECGEVTCLPALELRAVNGPLPPTLRGADLQLKVTGRCAQCVA
jgi:Fur family transcriptional regulator, ferric uptake regulator